MANIDNLNFKVIIDDAQFNQKIKAMENMAKKFNTSLSNLLNVQAVSQELVVSNRKRNQMETDNVRAIERQNREKMRTAALEKKLNAQVANTTRSYQSQSRILNELKTMALGYLSVQGVGQLLSSLIRVTGEFELQKTTLAAMLGDLNMAEQVITRIQGLAVESPFQFKELTTYAKQLSAFSVPAQELYDTTKMLADVSAGLGVGMDRIVLAYGQVRSAAFLRGQEVRQFTEAGIPILDELAKQFSELEGRVVSTTEVFDKISKRLVPFEMVAKVFKDMTSEGGKFYNMQEVQAETLRGKISNLKDAYEVMLNEIGKGQSENLKGAVDWARRLMQNYEQTGKVLAELVVTYGVYKAALLTLTIVTHNFALANSKLYTSLINATKWAINNPYVILAAGITAAGYAIYKNITALEGYEKVHKSFVETEEKYNASLSAEGVKLDALYAKLRLAKEGTEEYEKAKKQIYTQYAGYISDLKEEGVEVGNLANLYDSLKIKVEEYTKAKFRSLAQSDLDQTFEQEVSVVRDRYKTLVSEIESIRKNAGEQPLSAMDKEGLWQYITGDIATLWDMAENPDLKRIKGVLASKILPFGDIAKELQGDLRKIKSTYASDMQAIINLYGETSDELAENDPFKVPLGGDGDGGKSPAQKAIEEQIRSVQKLQDAYEKLMPFLNDSQMKDTLSKLFPDAKKEWLDSFDFSEVLRKLADDLAKYDSEASERLKASVGKDVAGSLSSAFKEIEAYKKMLDEWLGEDFSLEGEGVSFDISKIIQNLNNQYAKVDQKRLKAQELLKKAQMGDEESLKIVREVYGEEVWQKYITEGKNAIDQLANAEKESARKTAHEKVRELADTYVKERLSQDNVDLTDFGDKTLKQVETLIERMRNIRNDISTQMQTMELVASAEGWTDETKAKYAMLAESLKQLGIVIADTGEEYDKKLIDKLKDSLGAISDLAGNIQSLGDAIEGSNLSSFAKDLGKTSDIASNLVSAFESDGKGGFVVKDAVGLIATVASAVITTVTDVITASQEHQRLLNEAALEYRDIMLDIRRESFSGIFGTDEMALAAENQKILTESLNDYNESLKAFEDDKKLRNQKFFNNRISLKKMSVSDVVENIADASGWDLYRENGELNMDALIAYYDSYAQHLTSEQKNVVDALIASYDAQNDAATQSAEYMKSLFSGVADSIASDMVDAFIESGDAAIDMKSVVSDVASQMASDLIKSLYILPILNDYAKELDAIQKDSSLSDDEKTARALSVFQTAVAEIEGNKDAINETLSMLDEYFAHPEDEGTDALGQGIKGITEDQANLLASYLNAIRADVAYSKTLWQKMDANLQRLADMFTSSPTLMEYQAQIAANTYNTAIATQEILSQLRSVVTSESGDTAIRVYS